MSRVLTLRDATGVARSLMQSWFDARASWSSDFDSGENTLEWPVGHTPAEVRAGMELDVRLILSAVSAQMSGISGPSTPEEMLAACKDVLDFPTGAVEGIVLDMAYAMAQRMLSSQFLAYRTWMQRVQDDQINVVESDHVFARKVLGNRRISRGGAMWERRSDDICWSIDLSSEDQEYDSNSSRL